MIYFSGFSLEGEKALFDEFLDEGDFTVAGFSYGAQKAFEFACSSRERIEKLILLSPAFFQTQKRSFIRAQLRYFEAGKTAYIEKFLKNTAYPSRIDLSGYLAVGSLQDLESLLSYRWEEERLKTLIDRGTRVEVYLGGKDRIVDSRAAFDFFSSFTSTYLIKEAGHLLRNKSTGGV